MSILAVALKPLMFPAVVFLHFVPLAPAIVVMAWWIKDRGVDRASWMIASAIAVSFVVNAIAFRYGNARQLAHVYPAIQMAIVMFALSTRWPFQVVSVGGIALLSILSHLQIGPVDPELVVRVGVPAFVCLLVWHKRELELMRLGLLIYFGIGVVAPLGYWIFDPGSMGEFVAWLFKLSSDTLGMAIIAIHLLRNPPLPVREERRLTLVRI